MQIIGKAIIPVFLAIGISTSCKGFLSTPTVSPTDMVETSPALARTQIVETEAADPALGPSLEQFMSTPLLPRETSIPPTIQSSPTPVPVTSTTVVMENGITWTECVAPGIDYAHAIPDFAFAADCFQREIPTWDDHDRKIAGEWLTENIDSDLQQVIGNDVYVVKQDHTNGCCDYEFLKNGNVVIQTSAPSITFNPNQHLWSIDGKVVWELVTDPPTIFVDGVDFNQKYQWEGIYKPYSINDKLLYIVKQNGKFHIVFDEEIIGPQFDEIYIKYCCGTTNVRYGSGQYWFWGKRAGTYYVVAIR